MSLRVAIYRNGRRYSTHRWDQDISRQRYPRFWGERRTPTAQPLTRQWCISVAYFLIALGGALAYLDYLGSANLIAAGSLLKQEVFTGTDPFAKWAGAIIIVAMLGYIPEMRDVSMALLVLIFLVIILDHSSGFSALIKGV